MNHLIATSRYVFWLLLCAASAAVAQVSVGVSMPGVSIGINMPVYPQLVRVPNYPVYYAPGAQANFFFYDGLYWVYQQDNWYSSAWYNGPWRPMSPQMVPAYVLRVPVRYYRNPPTYFRGWGPNEPPHWGEHWGHDWSRQRSGWDHWDRRAAPAPAPLPDYQRQYSGNRYPHAEQQPSLHSRNYGYQPRDADFRQHDQHQWPQQRSQPPLREQDQQQRQQPSVQQSQQQPRQQHPSQQWQQPMPQQQWPQDSRQQPWQQRQQPQSGPQQPYQQQQPYPSQQQPYQPQQKWPQ